MGHLRDLGVSHLRVSARQTIKGSHLDPDGVRHFRDLWTPFVEQGFQLHVYSPFPADMSDVDHVGPDWEPAWRAFGRKVGAAIGDLVDAWQLGNELNIWQFRRPMLTIAESARWVFAFAGGLREARAGSRLGTNAFGVEGGAEELFDLLYAPKAPVGLDYIAVDSYPGCWVPGGPESWRSTLDRAWELGRERPITIGEVGFPSKGEVAAAGELDAFLAGLGYASPEEVERDRGRILAASPEPLARGFAELPAASWAEDFEDSAHHLLKKWRWGWGDGPHSPEKQARYFEEALRIMLPDPRVGEVLLFMYRDIERCWSCDQADCPLETSWGFLDKEGHRKPVFSAVQTLLRHPW
jgi:hypothetical protein